MISVRRYVHSDFEFILPWFKRREWPNISSILPEDGWVAEDETGPLACVWLYNCGPIGFAEWSVTCPDRSGISTLKALTKCLDELKSFASSKGIVSVMQFIPDERLVKYYEEHCGFKSTERATLMVWNRG